MFDPRPDPRPKPSTEAMEQYCTMIDEYEGYFIDPAKLIPTIGGIAPLPPDRSDVIEAARSGLAHVLREQGVDLGIHKIVRANVGAVAGLAHYITLQASDMHFYEMKIWLIAGTNGETRLMEFRHARHYSE